MLLLIACVENEVATTDTGKNAGAHPDIEVGVQAMAFSTLVPDGTELLTVPIDSVGSADLHISGFGVLGSTDFVVTTDNPAPTLAPTEHLDLGVRFTADQAESLGTLLIWSDDPDTPELAVSLSGSAYLPELFAFPNPVDLGTVSLACPKSTEITLQNIGNADAHLEDLVIEAPFAATFPALPLTLAPGETTQVPVSLTYEREGPESGTLRVSSDAPTLSVALSAKGSADGLVVDEFYQHDGPYDATDLVLYIDQSGSMSDDQDTLAANVTLFSDALAAFDLDWQLIVATRDDGCHNGGIFTQDTPDFASAFSAAVHGGGGVFTEAGLSIARNAANASCNADFFRGSDAKVQFVLISDEPEQSPEAPLVLVGQITDSLPNAAISVIVGEAPSGCATAVNGSGYHEAAIATGGVDMSICLDDWSAVFEEIAKLSSEGTTDTFGLSSEPDPDTIVAEVDGVERGGWSYDATYQTLVFAPGSIPEPGSTLTVTYSVPTICD